MKCGFVVNDVQTEEPLYTTIRLAMAATKLGHEAWILGVSDFIYAPDGSVHARARSVKNTKHDDLESYLAEIQEEEALVDTVDVGALDVLMLRNDPSEEGSDRGWAQTPGILFGQLAMRHGVIVLNHPMTLANAINKTYFQHFPEVVRPHTCISRNAEDIKKFVVEQNGEAVIKPLQGSGGKNVFLVRDSDMSNMNQMIDAVLRDGYCIAQEYLPAAQEGDVRLFVMNGHPLEKDGKYAAFRRVSQNGDIRSNMHSGSKGEPAEIDDKALQLVKMIRPKLVADGMFLVGLDIVEDKLMEINIFSPGGLGTAHAATGIDFAEVIIHELESKVELKRQHGDHVTNIQLATL